jgi:16S rRNA (cytosine1402-N4)-methyltransferase
MSENKPVQQTAPVKHIPVLLQETITALELQPTDIVVDGTFGGGGHSRAILEKIPHGTLICVDLDEAANGRFTHLFGTHSNAQFVASNFKDADSILAAAHLESVDKVLLDLGTSTFQLLADTRGFSFQSDTPLSMTFSEAGSHTGFTAATIVNDWGESSIADIIYHYGEEPKARTIARAIVEARNESPIATARELGEIIASAIGRRGKIHPATKTFQALRIAVNDELATITAALNAWLERVRSDGRIAVITFHSLEDRTVKYWMRSHTTSGRVITKHAIQPTRAETVANPRARSAKLRVFQKH